MARECRVASLDVGVQNAAVTQGVKERGKEAMVVRDKLYFLGFFIRTSSNLVPVNGDR